MNIVRIQQNQYIRVTIVVNSNTLFGVEGKLGDVLTIMGHMLATLNEDTKATMRLPSSLVEMVIS